MCRTWRTQAHGSWGRRNSRFFVTRPHSWARPWQQRAERARGGGAKHILASDWSRRHAHRRRVPAAYQQRLAIAEPAERRFARLQGRPHASPRDRDSSGNAANRMVCACAESTRGPSAGGCGARQGGETEKTAAKTQEDSAPIFLFFRGFIIQSTIRTDGGPNTCGTRRSNDFRPHGEITRVQPNCTSHAVRTA